MLQIHKLLRKYDIVPNKLYKEKNVFIIDNKYVIKNGSYNDIYKYLEERNFDYYPKVVTSEDGYLIEEYINNNDVSDDIKIEELIELVSLLHNKTTTYKKVVSGTIKEIYENINDRIVESFKFYDEQMIGIEEKEIFDPSDYVLSKNISLVFKSLTRAKDMIDSWYETNKKLERLRYVVIHNNLDLTHFIKNEKNYLISWNRSKIDLPIYDIYNLFMNNELDYELVLDKYMSNYQLLDYEKDLLIINLLIPLKINDVHSEFAKISSIIDITDRLYKFNKLK